jgi:hypothetical protein
LFCQLKIGCFGKLKFHNHPDDTCIPACPRPLLLVAAQHLEFGHFPNLVSDAALRLGLMRKP